MNEENLQGFIDTGVLQSGVPTSKPPKTLGEFRVRTDFNVSGSSYVDEIKKRSAELVDFIDQAAGKPEWDARHTGEFNRLKALALTNLETAAMYAVKMATL